MSKLDLRFKLLYDAKVIDEDTYNKIFADKVNVFNCMGKLKKLRKY